MTKYFRPTIDTKFHIDFNWWQKKGNNLRGCLQNHSCPEFDVYSIEDEDRQFDWISPDTGEVFTVDVLWHLIRQHCINHKDFIDEYTPLVPAIFRTFLINDNLPLTAVELHDLLQRQSPEIILKTIGGRIIHQGIRPIFTNS